MSDRDGAFPTYHSYSGDDGASWARGFLVICTVCDYRAGWAADRLTDAYCPNCGPLDARAPARPPKLSANAIRRRARSLQRGERVGGFAVIRAKPRTMH